MTQGSPQRKEDHKADSESRDTTSSKTTRLLAVGPLPPPLNGTSVSFHLFCAEASRYPHLFSLETIDTAPQKLRERSRIVTASNLSRIFVLSLAFARSIRHADRALVVGSHQFLFSAGAFFLLMARIAGRPCYFRTFGYLDLYYQSLSPFGARFFRFVASRLDGLFVETELSRAALAQDLGDAVSAVPGYRQIPGDWSPADRTHADNGIGLRLVSLGQIRDDKGIFILLQALRALARAGLDGVRCDIYGPILETVADRFAGEMAKTPQAAYCGIVEPAETIPLLTGYDALLFPTFYPGEGHPGVLMEAMMAGIPVVASRHRAIPELVEDGVNGFLITPGDPESLGDAILALQRDPELRRTMGRNNWERRLQHSGEVVVRELLCRIGLVGNGDYGTT